MHASFPAKTMAIAGAIAPPRVALATFHWRFASRQGASLVVNRGHVPTTTPKNSQFEPALPGHSHDERPAALPALQEQDVGTILERSEVGFSTRTKHPLIDGIRLLPDLPQTAVLPARFGKLA